MRATPWPTLPLGTLALASLLAGCATPVANERPPLPVPDAWPGSALAAPQAIDLDWAAYFPDPALRELIGLALKSNRDLRVAVLNIEQAQAQFQVRQADTWPTVNLAAAGSRTPTSAGGIASSYSVGLAISAWELDVFGRVAHLKDAALAQYLATEEARKAVQISLVAAVASAYLSLVADSDLLDLTRQALATREESQRLVALRFQHGAASELDLRQAESLTEAARVVWAQLRRQRQLDENALALLVGAPLPPQWKPASALESLSLADVPAGTPSGLLVRRPDIRQAEQQLAAASASIGAARAAFFPRITLTTGIGTASNQLSSLLSGGSWGWTLAPQALLPIFDAGRNQANLASAEVARRVAVAQYEKAIQTAFREVADGLAGRASWGDQLQAQRAQAQAEAARLHLADLRYRNGVASHLDLLDAQRSVFAARQAVVQARLGQLQSQVALFKALGGGWTEPPP